MALPEQRAAYGDCDQLYNLAHNQGGARAKLPDKKQAGIFQLRMHKYRSLLRADSRRMYERHDLRWDKSEFDYLKVVIEQDDGWWVKVIPHGSNILAMESLGEDHAPQFEPRPHLSLPPPADLPGDILPDDGGTDGDGDRGNEPGPIGGHAPRVAPITRRRLR